MRRTRTVVDVYIYICKLDARFDTLAFSVISEETPVDISTLALRPSVCASRRAKNKTFSTLGT